METEQVDYSEDPFLDRIIFGNPYFSMSVTDPILLSDLTSPTISPVVTLPRYNTAPSLSESLPVDTPGLEASPLSPGTLHILSTYMPRSLSFDPHPPLSTVLSVPPVDNLVIGPKLPPVSGPQPSGCFETPAMIIKLAKNISLEGVPNPFVDHPSAPYIKKKEEKVHKGDRKRHYYQIWRDLGHRGSYSHGTQCASWTCVRPSLLGK